MVPVNAVIEKCKDIASLEKDLQAENYVSLEQSQTMIAELESLRNAREAALASVRDEHAETEAICKRLEPLAGVTF